MEFVYCLAFDVLAEDRRGCLADRASFSVEERFLDTAGVVQFQFEPNLIAAKRILFAVRTCRASEVSFVVRTLVMIEDVIVVELFIHSSTYADCGRWAAVAEVVRLQFPVETTHRSLTTSATGCGRLVIIFDNCVCQNNVVALRFKPSERRTA